MQKVEKMDGKRFSIKGRRARAACGDFRAMQYDFVCARAEQRTEEQGDPTEEQEPVHHALADRGWQVEQHQVVRGGQLVRPQHLVDEPRHRQGLLPRGTLHRTACGPPRPRSCLIL